MSQYFVLPCFFTAPRAQSFPIFPALILEMQLGNKVYSQKRKKQKYAIPERLTSAGDNLVDRGPPCQTLRRAFLSILVWEIYVVAGKNKDKGPILLLLEML